MQCYKLVAAMPDLTMLATLPVGGLQNLAGSAAASNAASNNGASAAAAVSSAEQSLAQQWGSQVTSVSDVRSLCEKQACYSSLNVQLFCVGPVSCVSAVCKLDLLSGSKGRLAGLLLLIRL